MEISTFQEVAKNEKLLDVILWIIGGLITVSGWVFGIGYRAFKFSVMSDVADKFVSKDVYDAEMKSIRDALSRIETKLDGHINKLETLMFSDLSQ